MIPLPPGCTVTYAITIDIDKLTDDMVDWYQMIGGVITEDRYWDTKGREVIKKYVSYGKGKRCHISQNGSARLHFHGDDAPTASVFIIKFFDHVMKNNLQEQMERVAAQAT